MTKLEKFGLIIAIPSGMVTVLEYLEKIDLIGYLNKNLDWMPLFIKNSLAWVYEKIILFEVNIWLLLILIYFLFKGYNFFLKQQNYSDDTPVDYYQKMDTNHKIVFNVIANFHNKSQKCNYNSIVDILIKYQISNLEIEQILQNLATKMLISVHYNVYRETLYSLTTTGRDIAIELIKSEKKS